MVLLPGSSISTAEAKSIEAERINSDETDSIRGSPPPPYPFPTLNEIEYPVAGSPVRWFSFNPQEVHSTTTMNYSALPTNDESNSTDSSSRRCGFKRFGRRGCHRRGNGHSEGDRIKKHKRKHLFRKVLMRFTTFFILSMIWIHHNSIAQSVQKAVDALPQPITNLFSIIGHILYLPIAFSQTMGIAFYCAIISFLITIMHLKLRRRRMARWRNDLHSAIRARVLNGQPEHDHEAWPGQAAHFHHHPHHSHHFNPNHHHQHQHGDQQNANVNTDVSSDEYEKSSTSSSI